MYRVLIFACLLLSFTSACVHNSCTCTGGIIACQIDDEFNPQFTASEAFFTTEISLTIKQYGLLENVCALLPNLAGVTFHGINDRCPTVKCVKVICR